MAMSLQVAYPTGDGLSFDYDYYLGTHMPIVGEHMGPHIANTVITRGLAGGAPDAPAGYFAIATMTFADQAALDAALGAAGPAVQDIPNFYDGAPQMLVGEVIA